MEDKYGAIPDGKYVTIAMKAELKRSTKKETPYLSLWLKIAEGNNEGKYLFKKFWLTEKALPWVKKDLEKLNYIRPVSDLKLPEVLESFIGLKVTVSAKNKEENGFEFVDVFIIGCVEGDPADEMPVEPDDCVDELFADDVDKVAKEIAEPVAEQVEFDDIPF
jgi:hypothetical protein